MKLSQYAHTLRHLRWQQVYGRLWFRLYRPTLDLRPAPPLRGRGAPWQEWEWRPTVMRGSAGFRFLNVDGQVQSAADWDDPRQLKLWRYNLHYFDDLNSADSAARRAWHVQLIDRWIVENPPGHGTGWEPYPTSLRLVNWIKWALAAPGDDRLSPAAVHSLSVQARWLSHRIEIHLLGNHLWANGKALVFAGLFFDGPEANGWLQSGVEILTAELNEQFLTDGGHFERTPMYQGTLLEDVLDLINLGRVFRTHFPANLLSDLNSTATRMLRWLEVMSHPDGKPSFFNDAAFDIAADYQPLVAYARSVDVAVDARPLQALELLPESGYARLQNSRAVVICDVAPVGPDYIPGHAHADTLSFELSVDGGRALVNSGTSTYERGAERRRQRGTAAHNTVVVDGEDSSEVWDSFRVARRARPLDVRSGIDGGIPWLAAAHDGYRRLPGRVTHHRKWSLHQSSLSVVDRLDGRYQSAVAIFRWHPDAARTAPPAVKLFVEPRSSVSTSASTWHPEFGTAIETSATQVPVPTAGLTTTIAW